jgi:hypothetical protein
VGLALALALMVLADWPVVSTTQRDLRGLAGGQSARITEIRTVGMVNACGAYRLAGDTRVWGFVETREGLYAEHASNRWRTVGPQSPEARRWASCITRPRTGRASILMPLVDWLTIQIAPWS